MEKRNSQIEHGQLQWSRQEACCHVRFGCGSLSITIYQYEFDVRSVLHGQVNLAAVNRFFFVIRVAMNGCKNLKTH